MGKPEWLVITPRRTPAYDMVRGSVERLGINTVCVEAKCPNIAECWSSGTASLMVLGDLCTRGCRFCSVRKSARGAPVDPSEPGRVAEAVRVWGLKYVVITSVCRDDLADQGASHLAACISAVKARNPDIVVEVLAPDFGCDQELIRMVVEARPDVYGHNIETVERLSALMRDRRASYRRSLEALLCAKRSGSRYTKSALMLGAGETQDEVLAALNDLRDAEVDFVAIGQYLKPTLAQLDVSEYIRPERFDALRAEALGMGFKYVAAGPFVRSSYKAGEYFVMRAMGKIQE